MRAGVGTFCPLSRRPDLLEVLFPCALPPALDEVADFCGAALCPCAEPANTPVPAATSSVRARCVAFRTRMVVCVGCSCLIADCPTELCPTSKVSESCLCPDRAEPLTPHTGPA